MFSLQLDPRKGENFDKVFTKVPVKLTPTDDVIIRTIPDDLFGGFTYQNQYYTTQAGCSGRR